VTAAVVAAGRRHLPRGWIHFWLQVVIWLGFYFGYLGVRSFADRDPAKALVNGFRIIDFELKFSPHLLEHGLQRIADSSHYVMTIVAWTYWNSQFSVIGLSLLWVYLRRHDRFAKFRNTILLANVIGLVGFALVPTAPPWMFPSFGFVDGVNHSSGLVGALANPYAAMPSLHSADALVVGICLFGACRRWYFKAVWALWPAWVWFCVMATANHFWLDVLAGIAVALIAFWIVARVSRARVEQQAEEQPPEAVPIANLL
jgi:membrane-associated phospholipid phosphatase